MNIKSLDELRGRWKKSGKGIDFFREVARLCKKIDEQLGRQYEPGGQVRVQLFDKSDNTIEQARMTNYIVSMYKDRKFDVIVAVGFEFGIVLEFKFPFLEV